MPRRHGVLWALLGVLLGLCGCHGGAGLRHKNKFGGAEPGLANSPIIGADDLASDPVLIDGVPRRRVTWVDRHPLFRKPGEVYHATPGGGLAKFAKATFIGVPMGVGGEIRQVIVGCPPGF